jgi:repressor LexA
MELEEIKRRMKAKGLRQVDIANATGLEPDKVSKSFAGTRRFTSTELDIIRSLVDGGPAPSVPGTMSVRAIPMIGSVAAGNWREAIQQPMGSFPVSEDVPPNAVALRVVGDSMDRFVPDGTPIIFDPDDRSLYPERLYVIQNEAGETTFKQFMADPARLVPCSTNPSHKEILINGEEAFTIVGRVRSGIVQF